MRNKTRQIHAPTSKDVLEERLKQLQEANPPDAIEIARVKAQQAELDNEPPAPPGLPLFPPGTIITLAHKKGHNEKK